MKVVVLGATGNTGRSIVNGLLESDTKFEITALTRPSSVDKPENLELQKRGIKVVPLDLSAIAAAYKAPAPGSVFSPASADPELVRILTGADVVISAIYYLNLEDQIPLANAAKAAGVGRFVPCNFGTVGPRGVMALADAKYKVLDHIQRIRLPYTVIEVGWWYQISLPRVPSGKLDAGKGNGLVYFPAGELVAGGTQPSALTDLRDIGRWTARIVAAPGHATLNKTVFSYGEVRSQREVWELVGRLSGEEPVAADVSAAELERRIAQVSDKSRPSPELSVAEYLRSWGVRGDNTPENAEYLGFVSARELFPDFKPLGLEAFVKEALA
ncbi:hypothetical protein Micbo1qcDRAFT_149681 [Microdochium bolleyi]|uniref:NmrA-like domain-containing protein n=1 Tax=Microdochium bolleyi TaxID=196109 RepID=A0A136IYI4_9PEZI|nr:hypothetical protein Micbo1qcDRAFT_149681 [Microdochium bolleyi]